MELWDHICESIEWLVQEPCFQDRLAYASDVSSFERWLQFELAYAISRKLYKGIDANAPWVKPEDKRRDIAVVRGAGKDRNQIGHGELKVIFNNNANSAKALRGIRADWEKLGVPSEEEPIRFLVVGLANLKYPNDGRFKYQKAGMPESLDKMVEIVMRQFKSERIVQPFSSRDLNLKSPEGGREKGEFRLILLRRETVT